MPPTSVTACPTTCPTTWSCPGVKSDITTTQLPHCYLTVQSSIVPKIWPGRLHELLEFTKYKNVKIQTTKYKQHKNTTNKIQNRKKTKIQNIKRCNPGGCMHPLSWENKYKNTKYKKLNTKIQNYKNKKIQKYNSIQNTKKAQSGRLHALLELRKYTNSKLNNTKIQKGAAQQGARTPWVGKIQLLLICFCQCTAHCHCHCNWAIGIKSGQQQIKHNIHQQEKKNILSLDDENCIFIFLDLQCLERKKFIDQILFLLSVCEILN